MLKLIYLIVFLCFGLTSIAQSNMSRFDRFLTKKDSVISGKNKISQITDGIATFNLDTSQWGTWSGWAVSSFTDTLTGNYTNQFSAITGGGVNGSQSYLIAYDNPQIKLNKSQTLTGMFVTNATFADSTIVNGNPFAKKFGGSSGDDPDYFYIRAIGIKNNLIVDSSDFYLANYTSKNNAGDYSLEEWKWWDLSALDEIDSIYFKFFSSDVGANGINTPAYFCIDNFNGIAPTQTLAESKFESFNLAPNSFYNGSDLAGGFSDNNAFYVNNYNPNTKSWNGFAYSNKQDSVTPGFENQYSAFSAKGFDSETYAVANGYGDIVLELPYSKKGHFIKGLMITNTTYAALSMLNGDGFAKKFGGPSGDDKDWMKVDIIGYNYYNKPIDTVEFYLADYRFDDNNLDYIVKNWAWVDLYTIQGAVRLEFELSSSDNGQYGMNTPAYFCIDNFNTDIPVSTKATNKIAFAIYPNPAVDMLNIGYKPQNKQAKMAIYNSIGETILSGNYARQIQIEGLKTGMYILQINDGDLLISSKFQKL